MAYTPLPDNVTAGRSRLLNKAPYIGGPFLTNCRLVYQHNVPNAMTDGKTVTVGDWFCGLSLDERLFVLAHEALHTAFHHPERAAMYAKRKFGPDMKLFAPKRFNAAGDYYINAILVESSIGKMPSCGLYDPQYTASMTVDHIYTLLPEDPNDKPDQDDDDGTESGDNGDDGNNKTKGKGKNDPGNTGNFDQHLPPPPDSTPLSQEELEEAVKAALSEIEMSAKLAGADLPGALGRVIKSILEPKIDWKTECRQFCQSVAGRDETTWSRINRRRLLGPPHLPYPGKDGHQIDTLVIAPDCSGSISEEDLAEFLGEMRGIMEDLNPRETHVLWWDTGVTAVEITDPDDLESLTAYGGGGTSYSCVPDWLDNNHVYPDLVICLTDLFVAWPDPERITWPHLTVGTYARQHGYETSPAPFGKTLYIHD